MTDRTKEFSRISKVFSDAGQINNTHPSGTGSLTHQPLSQLSRAAQSILDSLTSNEKLVADLTKL